MFDLLDWAFTILVALLLAYFTGLLLAAVVEEARLALADRREQVDPSRVARDTAPLSHAVTRLPDHSPLLPERLLEPPRSPNWCPAQNCGRACDAASCRCAPCFCARCKTDRAAVRRRRLAPVHRMPSPMARPRLFAAPQH